MGEDFASSITELAFAMTFLYRACTQGVGIRPLGTAGQPRHTKATSQPGVKEPGVMERGLHLAREDTIARVELEWAVAAGGALTVEIHFKLHERHSSMAFTISLSLSLSVSLAPPGTPRKILDKSRPCLLSKEAVAKTLQGHLNTERSREVNSLVTCFYFAKL